MARAELLQDNQQEQSFSCKVSLYVVYINVDNLQERRNTAMKRKLIALILASMFCVTACSGNSASEDAKAGTSTTEEVDQMASEIKEKVGDSVSLPSESVTKAVSGTWRDQGNNDLYVLSEDGTGTKNGEALTFECGFDDDNNITIRFVTGEAEGEKLYAVSTDDTGYGINFTSLDGGGETIALLPEGLKFLDLTDERVTGILGEWKDDGGNTYRFKDDHSMVISGSKTETEGVFNVVENEEGTLLLKMKVPGGSLEFTYELDEENAGMDLQAPGDDTVHHWTRQ